MGRRPKLGQHFLRDRAVLARIGKAAVETGETALEIGPGQGALTKHLIRRANRVIALEVDPALAAALRRAYGATPNLCIVRGDVLQADLAGLVAPVRRSRAVLVGNLPYYITSPILRAAFAAKHAFRRATFLMQREVAERAVACGGKRFGLLSCLCQLHSEPRLLFRVPSRAFSPPPAVESALVRFELRSGCPPTGLLAFLRACLASPRKTLRNNLAGRYPAGLVAMHASAGKRAQQIGLDGLVRMWESLERAERSGAPAVGACRQ